MKKKKRVGQPFEELVVSLLGKTKAEKLLNSSEVSSPENIIETDEDREEDRIMQETVDKYFKKRDRSTKEKQSIKKKRKAVPV